MEKTHVKTPEASKVENQKGIENHKKTATHLEAAAKSHLEAAKHYEAGNHDKAAISALKAHGHSNLAKELQKEEAKRHATNEEVTKTH